MNRFRRGIGEMLVAEPCMRLQSKNSTEPASPVHCSMPCRSNSVRRRSSSGTPTSCFFSERRWFAGGVGSEQVAKVWCDPGITISAPFQVSLSVSATTALRQRGRGMPSSVCHVSKSECHWKSLPRKPGFRFTRLWWM
jgi:hypothetical protein